MLGRLYHIVAKNAMIICAVAMAGSTFASNNCTLIWYQDKEPEGLAEFAKTIRQ